LNLFLLANSRLIRIFGGDLQMYKDFLAECKQGFQEDDNDLLPIKMIDSKDGGKWTQVALRSKRPIASVITSNNIAEDVAKDMREFLDSESWYTNRGIPWRRGYLLYGKCRVCRSSFHY
jgi:chaperone BCS1